MFSLISDIILLLIFKLFTFSVVNLCKKLYTRVYFELQRTLLLFKGHDNIFGLSLLIKMYTGY